MPPVRRTHHTAQGSIYDAATHPRAGVLFHFLFFLILLSGFCCYVFFIEAGLVPWLPKPIRYAVYTGFITWNAAIGFFAFCLNRAPWTRQLWLGCYGSIMLLLAITALVNLHICELPLSIKRTTARIGITLISPIPFLTVMLFSRLFHQHQNPSICSPKPSNPSPPPSAYSSQGQLRSS